MLQAFIIPKCHMAVVVVRGLIHSIKTYFQYFCSRGCVDRNAETQFRPVNQVHSARCGRVPHKLLVVL